MDVAVRLFQQHCRKRTGASGCRRDRARAIARFRRECCAGWVLARPGDHASQSWRRGGLGSKALVTFTLRNGNDYAVKDIELFCSFARRDGSHLTDRKRMIHDIVNMKSRKTFARMHVGFVNVNADQAKCSLVAASRI
jgi:hypothetical protein